MLTLSGPQNFFTQAGFVRDAGDGSVCGAGIGLGMDDDFNGTSREFVGVLHQQKRRSPISLPLSPPWRGLAGFAPEGMLRERSAVDALA